MLIVISKDMLRSAKVLHTRLVSIKLVSIPITLIHQQSLEDIFLNVRGRRNASVYGKNRSWPYQEVEVLNFRKRDEYNALRDVFTMLCNTNFSANRELHEELNELSRKSLEGTELLEDFGWRSEHLNETTGYWELVASDIPYHLTQLSALETGHGPKDGLKPLTAQHVKQTLWHHSFYKDVQLVRNMFRCFHREDGKRSKSTISRNEVDEYRCSLNNVRSCRRRFS
jgi:hypothetical protein